MKRKKVLKSILAMTIMMTTFISCGSADVVESGESVGNNNEDVVIELWSYYEMGDVIASFEKENPGIKVNLTTFDYDEYELEYKKSLLKDTGDGDLFIIDSNEFGEFNTIRGLEDLSKSDYTAMNYKDDFDEDLWEVGKSLDKSKLLGLAISSAPIVTYYRADIMEKYGFPSDPEELAEFMKDPENWLKIGKTLRADGIHIVQWVAETIKIATSNMPYFNENLEYQRDNDIFRDAITIARDARSLSIPAFADIWSDDGEKLLKEGKLAMLYLGSWGASELEGKVPEQSGLWRATALPFGVYGWNNASMISMAANSTKKEAAWKFIEYYVFKYNDKERVGNVAGYLPLREIENLDRENEFLGGQKEQKLYEDLMSKTKEYPVTPLDSEAFELWDNIVNDGIENGLSSDKIMENIRLQVELNFKDQREVLLNNMKSTE